MDKDNCSHTNLTSADNGYRCCACSKLVVDAAAWNRRAQDDDNRWMSAIEALRGDRPGTTLAEAARLIGEKWVAERDARITELEAELAAIRHALNAADDSDLVSLVETVMAHRRLLAEHIAADRFKSAGDIMKGWRLARAILDDEPAPNAERDEPAPDERRALITGILYDAKDALLALEVKYGEGESWETEDALLAARLGTIIRNARALRGDDA